jgi:hypothetical protein
MNERVIVVQQHTELPIRLMEDVREGAENAAESEPLYGDNAR